MDDSPGGFYTSRDMIKLRKILRFINQINTKNICICGHSIDYHHGLCLQNDDGALHIIHEQIYAECETGYFEGIPLNDNPCQCSQYWDRGWFFMPKDMREIKKDDSLRGLDA